MKLRPNTGLPEEFIQGNVIVCCGEDEQELYSVMQKVCPEQPTLHRYRCYRAWKYNDFTVILTGIGTGSLEPLMFELLDYKNLGDKVPIRLVMIGTAGYIGASGFGKVYLVEAAYPVGCAVALKEDSLPLRPRFDGIEKISLPRTTEISTDYYYAATPSDDDERKVKAKQLNPALRDGIAKHWQEGRIISMETAQFYHFANIYGGDGMQYVALRGVANLADQFSTQAKYSKQVLDTAFREATALLAS